MPSSFSIPKVMKDEIEALVSSGYYSSKSDVVKDALRMMLRTRPELKIAIAIEMYRRDEVSIGRAAEIAGLTIVEFKETLKDRGIKRVLETEKSEKIDKKIKKIKRKNK